MSKKRIERATEVAKATMKGDLRDAMLDIIRDPKLTGKAWKDMKEDEQRQVVDRITNRVDNAIVRAVDIIASEGRQHIKVILKQLTVKDGIKGAFECSKTHELRHRLTDAQGDTVLVVFTASDQYRGQRAPVKIEKDQKELIDESEDEEDEEEENETATAHDPETGEVEESDEGAADDDEIDDDADEEEGDDGED